MVVKVHFGIDADEAGWEFDGGHCVVLLVTLAGI